MKRNGLAAVLVLLAAVGFCSIFDAKQAGAVAIPNTNLSSLGNARRYVKNNNPGYLTYVKGNIVLYHNNAGAGWTTTTLPGTVLTRNNDGSADEKNACVDISDNSYTFTANIWANRGGGCGSNGTTTSGYSGGQVRANPPNGVPMFLFIEDVDGLAERQHIAFTSSAVRRLYTPQSTPAFNVRGGNDLVSNGRYVNCTGQANCNAVVLILADAFNIKAGAKDGRALMRINNNTPQEYRSLTFNPQGGTFPNNQLGREDDEDPLIREYPDGTNLVRDRLRSNTSNEFPRPSRSGYSFAGWYDNPNGGGIKRDEWSMASDRTLYAYWTPSVTASYELTPGITVAGSPAIIPGQPATFAPSVAKAGTTASNIHWELARVLIPAGVSLDMDEYSADGSAAVCAHYAPATCTMVDHGDNVSFSAAVTALSSVTDSDTAGLAIGSRLCYALLVTPYTEEGNNYRQAISCVLVAATPTVQVLGNDLRAGSGFMTTPNAAASITGTVSTRSASWAEYAIMGARDISTIASQSGAINGSSDGQSTWSKLTFANASVPSDCIAGFGCFTGTVMLGKIPDIRSVVSSFGITHQVSGSISASGIPGILGGGINLNSFVGSAIIIASDDITIDQDIVYNPGTLTSKEDMPQLILIGNNINIVGSVQRVDAWLIARGTVDTCSDVATMEELTTENCNNQLRINGPVMASELRLSRTYQNASDLSQAAETIDLRGDAYVWANMMSRRNGSIQTTYITELPPRY